LVKQTKCATESENSHAGHMEKLRAEEGRKEKKAMRQDGGVGLEGLPQNAEGEDTMVREKLVGRFPNRKWHLWRAGQYV